MQIYNNNLIDSYHRIINSHFLFLLNSSWEIVKNTDIKCHPFKGLPFLFLERAFLLKDGANRFLVELSFKRIWQIGFWRRFPFKG
jgi:hypothetical protein